MSEKYVEFKLTDLPLDEFCVLLRSKIQKNLVEDSANKLGSQTELAKHLKKTCKSLQKTNWKKTIRDSYIPLWKRGKKFIPLDCLMELCSLSEKSCKKMKKNILDIRRIKGKSPLKFNKNFLNTVVNWDEDNLAFIECFYGINHTKDDIKRFKEFIKAIKFKLKGFSISKISKLLNIPGGRIRNWIYKGSLPTLAELLKHYVILGDPGNNQKWLSINLRPWRLKGPWIKVPKKTNSYSDVFNVIRQFQPLRLSSEKLKSKEKLFGYLLGVIIGDCNKDESYNSKKLSKRIVIELAQSHYSNLRFGEFTSRCANSLGLRMDRAKDRKRLIEGKKRKFYRWRSQLSPLIDWIVTVCLGLEEGQSTTYDPIKANWMLDASKDFKIFFIQGIFDSDGWVDLNDHVTGVASGPNTDFLITLFKTLGINPQPTYHYGDTNGLLINCKEAYSLPVFSPIVKSYRYLRLEKLIKAKRVKPWPIWLTKKVNVCIKEGFTNAEIIEKLLSEDSVAVMGKSIRQKRLILNEKRNNLPWD